VQSFACPFGLFGDESMQGVHEYAYETAVTTMDEIDQREPQANPYCLKRWLTK
jgi:hypothetical protein